MKAAGAACILAGAFLVWRARLRERWRRRTALADLCLALRRLAEEVRLTRTPLPALLARLAAGRGPDAAAFFRAVSDGLRRGEALEPVWRDAAAALPLSEGDRRDVAELAPALRGDEDRLRRAVLAAADRLEASGAEMDGAQIPETRRVTALTFCGAALLVILLY